MQVWRRLLQISALPGAILIGLSVPPCSADNNVCPDMTTHQQVLDAGTHYYESHGGSGSSSGFGLDVPTSRFPDFPKTVCDVSQYAIDPSSMALTNADAVPLRTAKELATAQDFAHGFEAHGDYNSAKKLYLRIIAAHNTNALFSDAQIAVVKSNLARVEDVQLADTEMNKRRYPEAALAFAKVLANIEAAVDIDVPTKLTFLKRVSYTMDPFAMAPHLSAGMLDALFNVRSEVIPTPLQKVHADAHRMLNRYQKELGCLGMSERLNQQAFKLEEAGMYAMAEKLYKDALSIKQLNLGVNNPDAISQQGELARLQVERGDVPGACKIYDQALASFRKLGKPDDRYVAMLEAYGDMLARAKKQKEADKIYDEARAFYHIEDNKAMF